MSTHAGRILAIDYGSKRVGLAVSDPTRVIARGAGTLANDERLFQNVVDVLCREDVRQIVVGMPYSEDGGKGKKAGEVESFIALLQQHTNVAVDTWDESSSSVDAKREFIAIGMKKKKRQQKARVDEMAARLILQDYLDAHS